jgi:hypothetical protein
MSEHIVITLLVLIQTVVVSVVTGIFAVVKAKQDKVNMKLEERSKLGQKENELSMKLLLANSNLIMVTVMSIFKENQEMDFITRQALNKVEIAHKDYEDFIKQTANNSL